MLILILLPVLPVLMGNCQAVAMPTMHKQLPLDYSQTLPHFLALSVLYQYDILTVR